MTGSLQYQAIPKKYLTLLQTNGLVYSLRIRITFHTMIQVTKLKLTNHQQKYIAKRSLRHQPPPWTHLKLQYHLSDHRESWAKLYSRRAQIVNLFRLLGLLRTPQSVAQHKVINLYHWTKQRIPQLHLNLNRRYQSHRQNYLHQLLNSPVRLK